MSEKKQSIVQSLEFIFMLSSLIAFCVGAVAWAQSTFQTVREANSMNERLDRIESKVDALIQYAGIEWRSDKHRNAK